nr:hypothetical protein CFP56_28594 [Quercus suber]
MCSFWVSPQMVCNALAGRGYHATTLGNGINNSPLVSMLGDCASPLCRASEGMWLGRRELLICEIVEALRRREEGVGLRLLRNV